MSCGDPLALTNTTGTITTYQWWPAPTSTTSGWAAIGGKTISQATLSELMTEVVARLKQAKEDRETAKHLRDCLAEFIGKEMPDGVTASIAQIPPGVLRDFALEAVTQAGKEAPESLVKPSDKKEVPDALPVAPGVVATIGEYDVSIGDWTKKYDAVIGSVISRSDDDKG